MKISTLLVGALLAISSLSMAAGVADPVIGTWKLNTAKSTGANVPKSETRTYAAAPGGGIALSWKRVGSDGKEMNVKTTVKYDGKDYPITGSPSYDSLSARRVAANTVESTQKLAGKPVGNSTRTISKDGKTLTLVSRLKDAKGGMTTSTLVYERQ